MRKILFILTVLISSVSIAQVSNNVKVYLTDNTKNNASVELTTTDLLDLGKLSITDKTYMIQSFTYSQPTVGAVIELDGELGKLSDEMVKSIKSLKSGDKITFKNIIVIDPTGNALPGNDIIVTIK